MQKNTIMKKILLLALGIIIGSFLAISFSVSAGTPALVVTRGGTGITTITEGQSIWGSEINHMIATSSIKMNMSTGAVTIGEIVINAVTDGDLIVQGDVGIGTSTPARPLHMVGDGVTGSTGYARFGVSATEYTEIGHRGANSSINAVGDGNLDFRHDDNDVMTITDGGFLGVSTSTPGTVLDIYTTATTTATIDSSHASRGGCLKIKDLDGTGYTYCTVNGGSMTCSATSCE